MSKEQLEEFREFIDFMHESIDIEDHQRFVAISESMLKDGWFKWIYRFAKEQSERVQELEESIKGHIKVKGVLSNKLHESRKENKRYLEVIENALTEGEFEDVHDQLERIVNTLNKALEGDPHD